MAILLSIGHNISDLYVPYIVKLEKTMTEFDRDWRFIDEFQNPSEVPYVEWIREDLYADIHVELRKEVDIFMRLEYEELQKALCKDRKKKYKPPKPERSRRQRRGQRRRRGATKIPKELDQQAYDKLIDDGVICSYPNCRLDDYIGDINMSAYELRNFYGKDPMHCMGDVKYVLRSWCLGMGPLHMKKARSMCIAGPPGCGKKFIAYSLCKEMGEAIKRNAFIVSMYITFIVSIYTLSGAVMFNLSPHIVVKYKEDLSGFVKTISTMAKIVAPCVYFINGAHYPFIKKVTTYHQTEHCINKKLI